jgi:hypothetical protein
MKRFLALLSAIAMVLVFAPASSAALHTTWGRQIGQSLTAVAVARDGSIYVAGSLPNAGLTKVLLAKFTPAGNVVWTRTWLPSNKTRSGGGPVWTTAATAVAVARDGTIYVTGSVQKTNFEGGRWFIRAYAPSGTFLRAFSAYQRKRAGGGMPQATSAIAIRGNQVVVAGYGYGCCDDPSTDGWIRAFDARLHATWHAQFEPPSSIPSAWFDVAESVSIGATGNIFVTGWAATGPPPSGAAGYHGVGTVVLEKLSSTGGLLWTHRTNATNLRDIRGVSVSTRGDRVMVTAPIQRSKNTVAWLGGYSLDGALLWSRIWGVSVKYAAPAGVAVDPSMSTWVVGTRRDPKDHGLNVFVRHFGPSGASLGALFIDRGVPYLVGSGVALRGTGAYVTGSVTNPPPTFGERIAGRVWRIVS